MSNCPDCGAPNHDETPDAENCGHATAPTARCHRSPVIVCPVHFARVSAQTMESALPGYSRDSVSFREALAHLNGDGYLLPGYLTWMALLGRYAFEEGTDPQEALSDVTVPSLPRGAPDYLGKVTNLVNFGSRAALLGDAATVLATFSAAREELSGDALLSFLVSAAASAHISVEANPACTTEHLSLYHLYGSQVVSEEGLAVLPHMVDMVMAYRRDDEELGLAAVQRLVEIPGSRHLVTAVDVGARTLGQLTASELTVLTGYGWPDVSGVVDVVGARVEDTPREVMAGVWAVRAAEAYAGAASPADATSRIRSVARSHGDPARFATDVVVATAQLMAHVMAQGSTAAQPGT